MERQLLGPDVGKGVAGRSEGKADFGEAQKGFRILQTAGGRVPEKETERRVSGVCGLVSEGSPHGGGEPVLVKGWVWICCKS